MKEDILTYLRKGAEVPTKGRGSKLSNKMMSFVDEYMVDMVAAKAVIRAGYKTNNPIKLSAELMAHPLVEAEIQRRMEDRREKNELSAEYVLQKLISIVDTTEKNNPQAALRGLELLGKHLGLYRERQEISGPDGEAIEIEQKKVEENVSDFTRKLASLAKRNGTDNVVEFPKPSGDSNS
jgi:phage terminase small subunit